ncbi:HpcH/HpaI aldolase/citrate lyase family protein [Deinococcus lacus]|uniref:HpcH/HpaI aldolase/citrate lyase family protein n=1 Tax=Deinococcus lacus TaxID=392561 RepID=A0ABW1YHW2_9DEIO
MSFVPPFDPWALGASLYAPATRPDLLSLGSGKYEGLGSLIYCTEDAIREEDVPRALQNLAATLPLLPKTGGPLRFIRPRNPEVLGALLDLDLSRITGFVLPKIHDGNLGAYMALLDRHAAATGQDRLSVLLTLETREALSEHRMGLLRDLIFQEGWQGRIGGCESAATT